MRTLDDILKRASRLSAEGRRRLVEELQAGIETDGGHEASWLAAMDAFLALGGTGRSDHTDVARSKQKHLAEIYSDKHE